MIYFVYILFDWLGIPRYVGKGHGNRDESHECYTDPYNPGKNEFIEQTWIMLNELPKSRIRENLSEVEAFETEKAFITAIGRADLGKGPLVNLTDGGEGFSGGRHSEETKQCLALTTALSWLDPSIRKNRIAGMRAKWQDPAYRENTLAAIQKGCNKPEAKARQAMGVSRALKGKPKSAAHIEVLTVERRSRGATQDFRDQRKAIQSEMWKDPEYRRRQSEAHKNPTPYIWITNGTQNRHLVLSLPIPEGWRNGKIYRKVT